MTDEPAVKPKPLEPQLLALQGQLAAFHLSDQQVRAIAAYTHPRSKTRGKAKPSAMLAGYSESFARADAPKWFRRPEIVRAINIAVSFWTETLEASTSMDVINDEMFHIATFDLGTLYWRDKEGVLRLKDLTKVDTRALKKIKFKRITKTDPDDYNLHTTTEEVELEVYDKIHGALLFARVKGALRDNRVGNTETPHRLTLNVGRGHRVTIEAEKVLEIPGEILDVTPKRAGASPAPVSPSPEGGTAGDGREDL